jgi:ABC-type oligopeptide transport system substrate-binding subunit
MTMNFKTIIVSCVIVAAISFLATACNKDKTTAPTKGDCGAIPTYNNEIKPILTTYCGLNQGACHGTGSGVGDYNTFGGLKKYTSNGTFKQRVLVDKDMPPSYSSGPTEMAAADLKLVQCWVDGGYLEK